MGGGKRESESREREEKFPGVKKNFRHAERYIARSKSNCHARKRAGGCT